MRDTFSKARVQAAIDDVNHEISKLRKLPQNQLDCRAHQSSHLTLLIYAVEQLFRVLDKEWPRGRAELLERSTGDGEGCEADLLLLRCFADYPAKKRRSISYPFLVRPEWVNVGSIANDLAHAMAKVQELVDGTVRDGKRMSHTKLANAVVKAWAIDHPSDPLPTAEEIAESLGWHPSKANIVRGCSAWKSLSRKKPKTVAIGDESQMAISDAALEELRGDKRGLPARSSRKRARSSR